MPRIIFVNRFFFPDDSATSQILSGLAFHLAGAGREIHVITGRQLYNDPHKNLEHSEIIRGVHVHRVATTRFGRAALAGRAVDYLAFYGSATATLLRLTRKGDVIVAKTDPPLLSIPAARVAAARGAHLVNWLQDIYPEVASSLGVRAVGGRLGNILTRARDRSLQGAAANVVLGSRMAELLIRLKVPEAQVRLVPNWSDDDEIAPVPHHDNLLRREWGLQDKFVVAYSGNLGRAHEYETLLGAAKLLRGDERFVFLLIGGGHHVAEVRKRVGELGLTPQFQFRPYQDPSALKHSLSAADVHWISLRPELEGLIVPSKFYGIAAAGRPTIAVTAENGEIAGLVRRFGAGLHVLPGDAEGLSAAIQALADDPELRAAMGERARKMLDAEFSKRHGFQRWADLLDSIPPDRLLRAGSRA